MTVLALLGALGTTRAMWEPQLEAFRGYEVRAFDLPGHGAAQLPDGPVTVESIARALLDELPPRFSFCGLSLGGMVGLWLGANAPERVERLVVACTGAKLGTRENYRARAGLVRREGTAVTADGARERWFTAAFRDTPEADRIVAELRAVPSEGYAACCEAVADFDFRDEVHRIAVPTLALFGAGDPVTPDGVRAVLLEGISGVREATIPHAAHLASVEQPQAFAAAVLAHLEDPHARGMRIRREVLGDEHVDRAVARTTEHTAAFQDFITRYAWGEIWARPGLDRRTRSAITLTALTALGRFDELELHLRAAVRNGLTHDEIAEVLLQCAVYCGVPAANSAFHVLERVLGEAGE